MDFYEHSGIQVEFIKVLPEKMFDYLVNHARNKDEKIDMYLFDVPWLPYLAEKGYLQELDELVKKHQLDTAHFIPNTLLSYGGHNGHLYAVPYMICTQLMYYRTDLFQDDIIRKSFYQQYGIPLSPPTNWRELNTIARFFTRKYNPHSPVEYGYSLDLSYPEELICELMPRLWYYDSDLYDQNGMINCNTRAMLEALAEMLECLHYSEPHSLQNRPIDTVHRFMNGEVAMVSMYYNYSTEIVDKEKSRIEGAYGYTRIPGTPVLAGWNIGLNPASKDPDAVMEFISWITSSKIAIPHTILGGQSPNISAYQSYDLAMLYPWLSSSLRELKRGRKRQSPRAADGKILSEKAFENEIFTALYPLFGKGCCRRYHTAE